MATNKANTVIKFLLLGFVFLTAYSLQAQQLTKIRGSVKDAETHEALPYVNVQIKGTGFGTITDIDGNFFLQARTKSDTLIVSFVGYFEQTYVLKLGQYQEYNFSLVPADQMLGEVVVKAGENPAWRIMREIIAHKPQNNVERWDSYQFEVYNKMEIDMTNVEEGLKDRKTLRDLKFVFDYMDVSAETGKKYLPVFISESLSDFYFQKSPKREKEVIKASQISGMSDDFISEYTGQMYVNVNIYDNFINVFNIPFVSPVNNTWKLYYKYLLVDSAYVNGHHSYLISFQPKRKQETTFTGEFWVADTTWAITKAKVLISKGVNMNYVKDFIAQLQFSEAEPGKWFLDREELFVEFNLTDKTTGLLGRKVTTRRNIALDRTYDEGFFSRNEPQETVVLDDAVNKDTAYWNDVRHEKLSEKEQNIYVMVDSIKEVKLVKRISSITGMLTLGFYDAGWWEFGPYFKTYSSNPIEGHRFRLGARTSEEFSTKLQLQAHVAYGTRDERFKYGASALYVLQNKPRRELKLTHKYDIEQLGLSVNAFTEDNILATILSREPNDNLQMVNATQLSYYHEWFQGLSFELRSSWKRIYPTDVVPFQHIATDQFWPDLTMAELGLSLRFAYNEKFVGTEFNRFSLGSEYPIVKLDLSAGLKGVLGADYNYYRAQLSVSHHFDVGPLGYFQYEVVGGKILGTVPYPLLKLHEGNGTYTFDRYAFNMMNYYEFASDTYLSVYAEHHFHGFFLNKIPLLRKLKWREIVYTKGLWGTISPENSRTNGVFDFPERLSDVHKPYFEAGVGIENIFKIFRLDAIWRLSYLDNPDATRFGLLASVQIIL